MLSNTFTFVYTTALFLTLMFVGESNGKPWAQNINPLAQPAFLDPVRKSCTAEIENLCQRCAKQTESPVVYPWCCTNHEGTREWCRNYLYYGLP